MSDSSKNHFTLLTHPNGTHTLVDAENGQAMHSRIGPDAEARLVYADRARVEETLTAPDSVHILYDVGMGTAANVVAALARIRAAGAARGRLEVYSFEAKPEGLGAALEHLDAFPELRDWAEQLRALADSHASDFRVGEVEVRWRLLVGDFYARLAEVPPPDTVFFDFYSPAVVPELWSLEGFRRLRARIGDQPARVFTYAAATFVRLNLLAAGFFVGAGGGTGMKSETTIAATRRDLLEAPLSRDWLRKLEASPSIAGAAFAEARAAAAKSGQWEQ